MDPPDEARHGACWYSRRRSDTPPDIGFHTFEDGQLLLYAHYFEPTRASLQPEESRHRSRTPKVRASFARGVGGQMEGER